MASILGNNEESSIVTSVIEDKSTNNMIKDVLQFLISPNFINQHLNTFIEVAERYLKLKFDTDTDINVRHNVVKYICCRGKLEQFIPENIICKYLKPGIHRIDDNVFFSIIYCLLNNNNNNNNIKDNNDFIFESFVKHGKELMVEYGGIMDMNILKQVKPPCRSLIGKILHFQKSKSNHQSSDWFDLVLQEDHNPKFNGIEILLTLNKHKAAYMLMEIGENYLCFRGIRILERFRRRGLTSTLLKVWLLLCTVLKKIPTTIKMNKPLLCIALLNLGLIPNLKKDPVEVGKPSWDDQQQQEMDDNENEKMKNFVTIWSDNLVRLRGLYSKSFLKTQQLKIVDEKPLNSRTIYISKYKMPSLSVVSTLSKNNQQCKTESVKNTSSANDDENFYNANEDTAPTTITLLKSINEETLNKHKCLFYNARLYTFMEMIVHEKEKEQFKLQQKTNKRKIRRHKSFKKYIQGEESVGEWMKTQQEQQQQQDISSEEKKLEIVTGK